MFEQFTEDSCKAIVDAQEECWLLRRGRIGTEHLLLGLLRSADDDAGGALAAAGVDLLSARRVLQHPNDHSSDRHEGHIAFTSRAREVLEQASQVAIRNAKPQPIGRAHLLRGLLLVQDGKATHTLRALGVQVSHLAFQVDQILGERSAHVSGPKAVCSGLSGFKAPQDAVPLKRDVDVCTSQHWFPELVKGLKRFGAHDAGCDYPAACSCGLSDLIARAEKMSGPIQNGCTDSPE